MVMDWKNLLIILMAVDVCISKQLQRGSGTDLDSKKENYQLSKFRTLLRCAPIVETRLLELAMS